jgi:hypothetical protein
MPHTIPECPQQGGLIVQVKDSIGSGLFLLLPLIFKKKNEKVKCGYTNKKLPEDWNRINS